MLLFLNVIYVLIAIAMIALILMQRGAGAQAGSGFGGGASGTVFGSRGASNFLSKSTKWLAITFFSISLFMAWHATRNADGTQSAADLGLMSQTTAPVPAAPGNPPLSAQVVPAVPSAPVPTPQIPVPVVAPQTGVVPESVPPAAQVPAAPPQQPAPALPPGN